MAPKLQRITTKLITVSCINKVFQARCKDFQGYFTAFRPLLPSRISYCQLLVYTKSSQVIDGQKVLLCFTALYYVIMHLLWVSCIYWEYNLNILLLPPVTSYVYTHFAIMSKSNSCHTFLQIYRPIILTCGYGNHPWLQEIHKNGPKESWPPMAQHNLYKKNLTKNPTINSLSEFTNTDWKLMAWTVTKQTN